MGRNKYLDFSGLTHYDEKLKQYIITGITNSLDTRLTNAETGITYLSQNKADKETTLSGYGITDAYTKSEVDAKVAAKISYKVVTVLPSSGETNVIYLVPSTQSGVTEDVYDEYMWIDSKWEKIGSTKADLSTKVDKVTAAVAGDIATFVSGGNIADSGKKFVTSVAAAASANDNNIATEKAVRTELDTEINARSTAITNLSGSMMSYAEQMRDAAKAAATAYTENAIEKLDNTVSAGSKVVVTVAETDGKLTGITVNETALNTVLDNLRSDLTEETQARVNAVAGEASARTDADTSLSNRIAALEAISGTSHTHSNKSILDGITSARTDAWDNAEANAKAAATAYTKAEIEKLDNTVSAGSKVVVTVAETDGKLTGITVNETALDTVLDNLRSDLTEETQARVNAVAGEASARTDADTSLSNRIAALEAISGTSHTHSNKSILDGITSARTDAWDNAEANAKAAATAYTKAEIEKLDNTVSAGSKVVVTVAETDGKLTGITVNETALDTAIANAEANAKAAATAYTDTQIAALSGNVVNALTAETKARQDEDVILSGLVYAEEQARISADAALSERIDQFSGTSHTHSNKSILDGITSARTDAWDNAEANAKAAAIVMLKNEIEKLDATVSTTSDEDVAITITEVDGKLTGVTATLNEITNDEIDTLFK